MRWPWSSAHRGRANRLGGYTRAHFATDRRDKRRARRNTHRQRRRLKRSAGALSRTFMAATQVMAAPEIVAGAVSPRCLAQIGRDLVRVGQSLHVIRYMGGRLVLVPASTWYWEGGADPATWTLHRDRLRAVRFLDLARADGLRRSSSTWGSPTARPYHGLVADKHGRRRRRGSCTRTPSGPWRTKRAGLWPNSCRFRKTAATATRTPTRWPRLKADIGKAKGDALLVETTAGGWQEGKTSAPLGDWKQSRLGPMPPDAMVKLADSAFDARARGRAVASPALFDDSDGTAKREALRQWHMGVDACRMRSGCYRWNSSEKLDSHRSR